jgi:hypothetical protein
MNLQTAPAPEVGAREGSNAVIWKAKRAHVLVGGAIGLNLLLATAAVAGVVPRPSTIETVAALHAAATDDTTPKTVAAEPSTTAAPDTTVPTTTTPPTTSSPSATKTEKAAPAAIDAPTTAAPAVTTPSSTAAPTTTPPVTLPPRTNPSSAQVQAAIQQLHQLIPFYTPTEAQARQFGDSVCTAFDQGQTYSQVQATVLKAVSAIPLITVTAADADAAIRNAVQLFCPGYSSRLP